MSPYFCSGWYREISYTLIGGRGGDRCNTLKKRSADGRVDIAAECSLETDCQQSQAKIRGMYRARPGPIAY